MEKKATLEQYCIDVIRAAMNGTAVSPMPEGISLADMFAFSKKHGIEAIVFHGLSALDIDEEDPVWANWAMRADMLLTQSIVQLSDRDMLFELTDEAGIDLMPIKGSWLKEAYPQIDFRQMADLDMLIRLKDRERAKKLMLDAGFMEEPEHAFHHDSFTKEPYTNVELHFQLIQSSNKYYSYFENVWDKARPVEGYSHLYRLSAEDEYIFYFVHLKKHMDDSGCGIRFIMDCAVFQRTYPDMDRAYLRREFTKLGLFEFVQSIEKLSECWFCTGDSIPPSLWEMAESILQAGTYGTIETVYRRRMDELKKKYKNPALQMIVYWMICIFRPLWFMKHYYPILERFPVLLPFTWIARIIKKCVSKPTEMMYQIKQVYKEGRKNG